MVMSDMIEININGVNEQYTLNEVAKQADGSLLLRINDSVMLATVVMDEENSVDEDFLPLTVQYVEKSYAVGKFPGGFIKREQKPGDFETLTSRLIDRSIRPLFPEGYRHPTVVNIIVLSADDKTDLQAMALNAAANALYISSIPVDVPVSALRVGKVGDEFVVNPSQEQMRESSLDLFVAGTNENILMIEQRAMATTEVDSISEYPDMSIESGMGAGVVSLHKTNEISEDELISALELALESLKKATANYGDMFSPYKKPHKNHTIHEDLINRAIYNFAKEKYRPSVEEALFKMSKSERASELKDVARAICEDSHALENEWEFGEVYKALGALKRELLRESVLFNGKRADGRGLEDIRDISIKTNILPSVHSSVLFTRGQTQALVTATLGGDQDAQMYENLSSKGSQKDRLMVHYNFPSFSVNEASPLSPPGRRELGHGNLARRAVEPTLIDANSHTIRLVSEILESNGSSSMATVCGASLALKAANLEISSLVAGVAMGLVKEESSYAVLTDIMGLEDHDGDLDCKVAGSRDGITAMQMDIKLGGLPFGVLQDVLHKAKEARIKILDIMDEAAENIVLNDKVLPSTEKFLINPARIVDIIGQAGKTIKEIIEKFEVSIDLDREKGEVKVTGSSRDRVGAASEHIKNISNSESSRDSRPNDATKLYKEGDEFRAPVKKIVDFGAFVELPKGFDGLLHISKISSSKVQNVNDYIKEGDELDVKILSVSRNRVELALLKQFD
jgi:polyribonucleotide nucleotidyltransferase